VKGSKGFSLLELLVVVAILGILVAIALPRYFDAVADAKRNAQKTNIAIIRTSLEYYRNKNNRYPYTSTTSSGSYLNFNDFLKSTTYFSETPICPYNNMEYSYTGTNPGNDWVDHPEWLYYVVDNETVPKSYTLTYTAP
jgi:general secretion pathway protein G